MSVGLRRAAGAGTPDPGTQAGDQHYAEAYSVAAAGGWTPDDLTTIGFAQVASSPQRQEASNRGQFIAGDVASRAAAGPTGKPQAGCPVAFASTSGWLHRMVAAHDRNALDLELRKLHRYRLIIIDEVGYLGAQLRERGVGLLVLEQGIDTTTVKGRAMLGVLSVLAEFQRELIVANTRDRLAAARARGRVGGRRPKLTPAQAAHSPSSSRTRAPTPSSGSPTCSGCRAPPSTGT